MALGSATSAADRGTQAVTLSTDVKKFLAQLERAYSKYLASTAGTDGSPEIDFESSGEYKLFSATLWGIVQREADDAASQMAKIVAGFKPRYTTTDYTKPSDLDDLAYWTIKLTPYLEKTKEAGKEAGLTRAEELPPAGGGAMTPQGPASKAAQERHEQAKKEERMAKAVAIDAGHPLALVTAHLLVEGNGWLDFGAGVDALLAANGVPSGQDQDQETARKTAAARKATQDLASKAKDFLKTGADTFASRLSALKTGKETNWKPLSVFIETVIIRLFPGDAPMRDLARKVKDERVDSSFADKLGIAAAVIGIAAIMIVSDGLAATIIGGLAGVLPLFAVMARISEHKADEPLNRVAIIDEALEASPVTGDPYVDLPMAIVSAVAVGIQITAVAANALRARALAAEAANLARLQEEFNKARAARPVQGAVQDARLVDSRSVSTSTAGPGASYGTSTGAPLAGAEPSVTPPPVKASEPVPEPATPQNSPSPAPVPEPMEAQPAPAPKPAAQGPKPGKRQAVPPTRRTAAEAAARKKQAEPAAPPSSEPDDTGLPHEDPAELASQRGLDDEDLAQLSVRGKRNLGEREMREAEGGDLRKRMPKDETGAAADHDAHHEAPKGHPEEEVVEILQKHNMDIHDPEVNGILLPRNRAATNPNVRFRHDFTTGSAERPYWEWVLKVLKESEEQFGSLEPGLKEIDGFLRDPGGRPVPWEHEFPPGKTFK